MNSRKKRGIAIPIITAAALGAALIFYLAYGLPLPISVALNVTICVVLIALIGIMLAVVMARLRQSKPDGEKDDDTQ